LSGGLPSEDHGLNLENADARIKANSDVRLSAMQSTERQDQILELLSGIQRDIAQLPKPQLFRGTAQSVSPMFAPEGSCLTEKPSRTASRASTVDPMAHNKVLDSEGMNMLGESHGRVRSLSYKMIMALASLLGNRFRQPLVWLAEWIDFIEEPERKGSLYRLTASRTFENVVALSICVNAIFVAASTDWEVKHHGAELPLFFQFADASFLCFFCIELALRLIVHRQYFFCNQDARWNIFDFTLVLISIQDLLLTLSGSAGNVSFLRILRLLKLAKILRTLRVFQFCRDLTNILESFRRCLASLFWSFVMVCFSLYIFALIFVQGVVGLLIYEGDTMDSGLKDDALEHFGSVQLSIISLYMAVTGGNDWAVYYNIIKHCGQFYMFTFLLFTFFFVFALATILQAVFVEKAVIAAQPDRDELIMEQCRKARMETEEVRVLCSMLDADNSGNISMQELQDGMKDETTVSLMASVGLEVRDAELFFKLITSMSNDTEIEIEEFVRACMSMKGNATGLDMQRELFETCKIKKRLHSMEKLLERVDGFIGQYLMLQPIDFSCIDADDDAVHPAC
jgi:hypothetical protein